MDQTPHVLQVRLLGGFDLQSGAGRDLPPPGRKVRAMMTCLALWPGKSWPREKLIALLWSNRGDEQARASLRQALAELRRSLGEPSPLRTDNDTVSLDPAMVAVDASVFERLARAERLEEAAALYRGALLDGHGVRDDAFEDWLRVEKPPRDLMAYDYFLRGRERDAYFDLDAAEAFFARAAELDPGYVHAHAYRAMALTVLHWLEPDPEKLRRAEACARTAVSLDDHDGTSHEAMGYVALHQRRFDVACIHLDRAVSLNPNNITSQATRANWLARAGRSEEALQALETAMRRDPFSPTWLWEFRFTALFHLRRYDEAIAALRNMATFHSWHYAYFAAAYAHAGRMEEARRELTTFLNARPGATVAAVAAVEPYSEPALLDHLLDGLRKAGLPG